MNLYSLFQKFIVWYFLSTNKNAYGTTNITNRMNTMNLRSLNFGLDETLIALQDSVAAFCAKEIADTKTNEASV